MLFLLDRLLLPVIKVLTTSLFLLLASHQVLVNWCDVFPLIVTHVGDRECRFVPPCLAPLLVHLTPKGAMVALTAPFCWFLFVATKVLSLFSCRQPRHSQAIGRLMLSPNAFSWSTQGFSFLLPLTHFVTLSHTSLLETQRLDLNRLGTKLKCQGPQPIHF